MAITTATGRLSVKPRPVAATVLAELLMVKVKVLVPPTAMASGAKPLAKPGCRLPFNVSVAVPLLPEVEVRSPVVLT